MQKKKLVMLTAYDYPTAKIVDEVGVDYILVGDSLGMVVLGHPDTKSVTMVDMVHHLRAVVRGAKKSHIVGDLPVDSYNNVKDAVKNARLLKNAGAHSVKLEGAKPEIISAIIREGIPVMGHLGLLPQTAEKYKVQGKDQEEAEQIYQDAKLLDSLGVFALVLECVPSELARRITENIKTPTIGIGAGVYCSGQVLVIHDALGLSDFKGRMAKQYINSKEIMKKALAEFKDEVKTEKFPTEKNSF
jgi:3-methyl-2-oxobutanoate hydroxymethyltransferase